MSDRSKIEWTEATWNPLRAVVGRAKGWHCVKVSPGCAGCYAESMNLRLGTKQPYTKHGKGMPYLDDAVLTKPLRWRKPRTVFVCSMTDLFGEWNDDATIDKVFAVMALTPRHTYQVLTKRAERMAAYLGDLRSRRASWGIIIERLWFERGAATAWGLKDHAAEALPNVWLGVSVEDQHRADERLRHLRQLFHAGWQTFISAEPLLELTDLHLDCLERDDSGDLICWHDHECEGGCDYDCIGNLSRGEWPKFKAPWVIVGGESGPKARPCHVAWVRSIRDQCQAASVQCFIKQLGAFPVTGEPCRPPNGQPFYTVNHSLKLRDRKGGTPEEWPPDLRIRQFPEPKVTT